MTSIATPAGQSRGVQRPARAVSRDRLLVLLVRGCATTAIVFGAPVDLRAVATFGPPR